ncbi:MAG: DUF362 domain-containing protein [Candidatus Nanoarchaeia archaeon]|jgi:uncharacterized protein (DUF362 family)/ferredoxin-like protein FixX
MAVYSSKKPEEVYGKLFSDVKGKRVIIKPNLVTDLPANSGVTTDLRLVSKLIKFLKGRGAKVIVAESGLAHTDSIIKKLKPSFKVVNLDNCDRVPVKSLTGLILKEFRLPKIVVEADLIISFAKMKTHALTTVTLSIKNLFGLLCQGERKKSHVQGLNESIVDLFSALPKVVGLVDGLIALDGKFGPVSGSPRKVGLVIGSTDPLACDSYCAKLMGANPNKITHMRLCAKNCLGSFDDTDVKGLSFDLPPFFMPLASKLLERYRRRKPYLMSPDNCVKCLECVNNCPVKAISKSIEFDYNKCIGCMVCVESCKHKALGYKLSLPTRVIHYLFKTFFKRRRK